MKYGIQTAYCPIFCVISFHCMVVISNLVLITSHPLFYEDIFKICHQCHNRFSGNMKKDKHIYTCQLWTFLYVF